jgi:dolichyl-phosphate beta-glucosyltransferase
MLSLETLAGFCKNHFEKYEILCVDDGSTDGTGDMVKRQLPSESIRVLRLPENCGKGFAVRYGMLQATGAYRFFTDADLPYHLDALKTAAKTFRDRDCDLVVGARELDESRTGTGLSFPRRLAGMIFSTVVRMIVNIDVKDTQCGFKGFRDSAAVKIFSQLETRGYAFDVEIFVKARVLGMDICKIPVTLVKHAGSKVRLSRDPVVMLWELGKIARRA